MVTESLNNIKVSNPFSGFGGIVQGTRFCGRRNELEVLRERVLGENFGNLAVIGLKRIGKSSLVWHGIMEDKESLLENNILPIYLCTGIYTNAESFFNAMTNNVCEELELYCSDQKIEKLLAINNKIIKESVAEDRTDLRLKFFRLLRKLKYRPLFILDEFDSAQDILSMADFQLLRELSYEPDCKICLITCSRQTIQEIEAKDGSLSNFYGTFKDLRLGMFNSEDKQDYWNKAKPSYNPNLNYKEQLDFYTGGHPYLMDYVNDYCFKNKISDLNDNSIASNNLRLGLLTNFDSIQDALKYEKLLDSAIQIVIGPFYNVTTQQIDRLLAFQFIRTVSKNEKSKLLGREVGLSLDKDNAYICFSKYLTIYFEKKYITDVPYWPLWGEVETLLRNLIKKFLSENYTVDWEEQFRKDLSNRARISKPIDRFNQLIDMRSKAKEKDFYSNASDHLVDYMLTRDVYEIFMFNFWDKCFNPVFGTNKQQWIENLKFLSDIRNPVAHINQTFLSEAQINKAKDICIEIKNKITAYLS